MKKKQRKSSYLVKEDSENDDEQPNLQVYRLMPNNVAEHDASACNMGKTADEIKCLDNPNRECMYIEVTSKDPFKAIQEQEQYCLPCEIDGTPVPCWDPGSVIGGYFHVMKCKMSCGHQSSIVQPEYNCINESGFVTAGQCLGAGSASRSKCMWMAYKTEDDKTKTVCGPCFVSGSGGWGCPDVGG